MLSAKGKWFVLTSLLTLVTLGIVGCRGFFVNAKQNGVTVSPSTLNLQVAGSQQLTASATFDDNSTPKNVTGSSSWASSDTQHVSVSSTGVVTGVATTTTPVTITATNNGFSGTSSVTVGATTITITCNSCTSGNTISIATNGGTGTTVSFTSSVAANWSSDNSNIISINTSNSTTGTGTLGGTTGTVTITANAASGSGTGSLQVSVTQ